MNKISKISYVIGGMLFLSIGLAGFFSSVYLYQNPYKEANLPMVKSKAIKECATLLRNKGFDAKASTSKGTIEVIHSNLAKWETSIAKMSYAFQSCEAMEMTDFCMGELCYNDKKFPVSGIVAKLKYQKPIKLKKNKNSE